MGSWPRPLLPPPGEKGFWNKGNLLRSWAAEALVGHKQLRDSTAQLSAAQGVTGYLLPLCQVPSRVLVVSEPACFCPPNPHPHPHLFPLI